jgi:hypothetical protein
MGYELSYIYSESAQLFFGRAFPPIFHIFTYSFINLLKSFSLILRIAAQKTKEDEEKEDELLKRLVEIIEERNDIVENMIRDENK